MFKLVIGKARSGKTAIISEEIREKVLNKQGNVLMIVPEQFSHECEKELCSRCGDTLSLYARVTSFKYLTTTLQSMYGGAAGDFLDNGGRLLCMALAARNVAPRMQTFIDAARSPELQNSLLSAVDEMKSADISPEMLLEGSEKLRGDLAKKISDLAVILEAYNSVVENGHADPSDTMVIMAKQIEKHGFGKGKYIYIDGFSSFTIAEMYIIRALIKTGADVTMCLTMDSIENGDEIFTPARVTALELLNDAKSFGVATQIQTIEGGKSLGWFRLALCSSLGEECECAAMRCLNLIKEENCRYRDIAIAIRGFDDYKAVLQSVFQKYGIPLLISERNSIASRPLPTMISCAYDIILGGWNSDDVISFIGTGLAPFDMDEADELTHNLALRRILEREKPLYLKDFEKSSRKAETASEHVQALATLLEDMCLSEKFEEKGDAFPEYLQMWDLVSEILEQFNAILGDSKMDADEFSRLIRLMLSKYDIGLLPASVDSVSAGDFDRMRKRNIKHLIVLGASEDRLPMAVSDSGIFTSDEKEELFKIGMVKNIEIEESLWRESFLIYNCLNLPSESIFYTFTGKPSSIFPKEVHWFRFEPEKVKNSYLDYLRRCDEMKMEELDLRANALRGRLSQKSVESLYGKDISISASKADQFYSCRYAYFCNYGLKAKKWEKEELTAAEYGTFVHYVLEHVIRDGMSTKKAIEKYVHENMNDLKDKSERYVYLFNRLENDVERIVDDAVAELSGSKFKAEAFEYKLPGYGIADRIDSWEHEGKKYLRVVDYKTGVKKFELMDIWNGKNMQMLMYLDALKKDNPDVEAAGIMYIPARDTYISSPGNIDDEELEKSRKKNLKRSGLVLDDINVRKAWEMSDEKVYTPSGDGASKEQFDILYNHIQRKLSEMTDEIKKGSIEANPYKKASNHSACEYCDFASTCGFTDGENGESIRNLEKMKDDEVWEKMMEVENNE